jgi:hypothetical protein
MKKLNTAFDANINANQTKAFEEKPEARGAGMSCVLARLMLDEPG